MKSRQAKMMGLLALAAMSVPTMPESDKYIPTVTDPEAYKKLLIKRGVQEFEIDGVKVIARNLENAKRKAKILTP